MIIKRDKDIIKSYFEDHSGIVDGDAEEVFFPATEKEAVEVLRSCSSQKRPLTISGAGTGVTGARVPFYGSVLATDLFNKIVDIDPKTFTARVQAGVSLQDLQKELAPYGLFYPPDPTEPSAFIGGNISTNASGARGLRYGHTRQYIKRLKLVLPEGDLLEIRRGDIRVNAAGAFPLKLKNRELKIIIPRYITPDIKNASGYYVKKGMDLIDLFIGHEGTLALTLEADLALKKVPEHIMSFFAFFPSEENAISFVEDARKEDVLSMEFMDRHSLRLLRERYNIPGEAKALIYFEKDYRDKEEDIIESWTVLLEKHNCMIHKSYFADTEKERSRLVELRHALPEMINEIIKRNRLPKVGTDIAVPHKNFRNMYKLYAEKLSSSGIRFLIFGHIGESHLHANILPASEEEYKKSRLIYIELVKAACALGGTVSAEHGIGKLKHPFLEIMYGKDNIMEMAVLKKSVDPQCILGLDNIFPKEYLDNI